MENSELLVLVILAALTIYGVANLIAAPILLRQFYRDIGFTDSGKVGFEEFATSSLLEPLATKHLFKGTYQGHNVCHSKCFLQKRPLFTLSKIKRKQMQSRWSVTQITDIKNVVGFKLLPKTDPATVMMMLSDPDVDLSFDEVLSRRYLLLTDDVDRVISLLSGEIKAILSGPQLVAIEVIDGSVIVKCPWPVERVKARLMDEITCGIAVAEWTLEQ